MKPVDFTIVIDTREQRPWTFAGQPAIRRGLACGDYSIDGLEDLIAIERKRKDDAIKTIIHQRHRFHRELAKLRDINDAGGLAVVVVEASLPDLLAPSARRGAEAQAIVSGLAAIQARFRVPVLFCGGRAEAMAYSLALLDNFKRGLDAEGRPA